MELVTGATGYVGGRLVERLLAEDRPVRALARDPSRVETRPGLQAVAGDVVTGKGVRAALEGCSVAYYLVHSMEAAGDDDFALRDRRAAETFAAAARAAGVERIVYLGGIAPTGELPGPARSAARSPIGRAPELSSHLESRLEVERILLDAAPAATALRASILIGAASSSFRILVRLVERLRVLPLPAWRANRTQPIAERDAIEFLARTPEVAAASGRSLDIVGPDVLRYGEMVEAIAEAMGVGRTPIDLGFSLTPPASAVVSAITNQPLQLVRPLMQSLERDMLPRDAGEAAQLYGIRPLPFRRAVERALHDWERTEELAAR